MKTLILKVTGLDCAEEVGALKATVGKLNGVEQLDFNLLNGTMTVSFSKEAVSEEQIVEAVAQAGLKAQPAHEGVEDKQGFWQRQGRKIMCILSGILAASGFVSHAVLHGSLVDALTGGEGVDAHGFPLISIVAYLGAVITGGWYVLPKAISAVRRLRADMNLLMSIAVLGALIIGEWFEAAAVAFLFSFSLLLESWSVGRARRAIQSLMSLAPETARYICPSDGDIMEKPIADVPVGVTVLVRPGEKFPLDGVISRVAPQ
jgi:Cd2+/Zn2+-exporting ATPase